MTVKEAGKRIALVELLLKARAELADANHKVQQLERILDQFDEKRPS